MYDVKVASKDVAVDHTWGVGAEEEAAVQCLMDSGAPDR